MLEPIVLEGPPRARGRALGEAIRERIRDTWTFYGDSIFLNPSLDVRAGGLAYLAAISAFRAEYAAEIEGIAEASGLEAWEIAALNARTEILHSSVHPAAATGPGECTALYFPGSRTLGQNWDWMQRLEALMVLVEIRRDDGHRILQLAEPGIIGKIGLNSAGIGVCLNILSGTASRPAVPVHVLLRAVLDCTSLDEVRRTVAGACFGTCSHMLAGDDRGRALGVELYGEEVDFIEPAGDVLLHTNHYVARPRDQSGDLLIPNSKRRYGRAGELLDADEPQSVERMQRILLDREGAPDSICAAYRDVGPFRIGTVSSIVMDLPCREMHLTAGNPVQHPYETVTL